MWLTPLSMNYQTRYDRFMSDSSTTGRRLPAWVRRALIALGCVVAVVLSAGGWVLYANDFAIREQRVTIPAPAQPLDGVLVLPKTGKGPFGLVVFVHGDGPADASRDAFYRPIWESFAKAGYASLSWNKPGVGGAPGNWLNQSMADRAAETSAAIDWARTRPDIDPHRVGIWGISQGGWVAPEVAVRKPDLQFVILVGPAINWMRQGEYNLRAELKARAAPQSELAAALARRERTNQLLRTGATYHEYRTAGIDAPPMSADRWGFVARNYRADVSATLPHLTVPVLLELGEGDRNVDVAETERVYRELVHRDLLTVQTYPHASHSLAKEDLENNPNSVKAYVMGTFAPRQIYAPSYLDNLRRYVQELPAAKEAR
ncbi:hypothetical protein SAMN04488580_11437 [Mycobacterium sp. 283mftsu]|nr:hypothetical protein SAMN04488580_11437 [Mycobacterium sp. 283mftsu]